MKTVRILFSALLVLAAEAAVAEGPKGAVYQITTPKPAAMAAAPAFYAWTPEGAGPYRSIIVHQHGCTREGDAQMMMNDVQWKSLAKKWHAASAAAFSGDKLKACWFPNRHFAEKWREYMATGRIQDSLPPPAPFNLTGAFANKRITLNWDADADLETGIKTFLVYRNGNLLDTLRYPNMPQTHFTMEKGYQRWNDSDQPLPSPAPAMTFTDAAVTDTGTYVYQVGLINWAGVAGPKSDGLTLKRGQVTGIGNSARSAGARSGSAAAGGRGEHKRLFLGGDVRIIGANLTRDDGAEAVYDARGALIFRTGGTEP